MMTCYILNHEADVLNDLLCVDGSVWQYECSLK